MKTVNLGPLSAIITPELAPADVKQSVVLLHGYGAPGTDLVGLAPALKAAPGTQFVFPQAPLIAEGMSGPNPGRAWWHIDMLALQMARMTGAHDELAAQEPAGLKESRELLNEAFSVLESRHGLRWKDTVVGGFSQGAMLSCDWTLRSTHDLRALAILSGTVICEKNWLPLFKKRAGLRVMQSHSPDDQVLPFSLAERLRDHMINNEWNHTFVPFAGGHGIPPVVLTQLSGLLS